SLIDLEDARSGDQPAAWPGLERLYAGVRGTSDIEEAFKRGASAVLGWPMDGAFEAPPGAASAKPDQRNDAAVIIALMSGVDRGDDIEQLERVLQRDPTLAFKLLRYLNSAAFGLKVEVSSFRHAIMLLGYAKLKRWLALLLTTASTDNTMKPIMYAALRRGFLMEELARGMDEPEMRDEMFICGLFSLLDHMLKQSFGQLLASIPMPERVRQALVEDGGPYQPYLELVRAIERESAFDYKACADTLMLGSLEVNQAVMAALQRAAQLE
ncbi:MAG TPA: HDOD domain-containing protein, partial [Burkholderiaceae bacterium]